VRSERAARTWLPAVSALYCLDGVIGVVTHVRGVARKPGGFEEPLFNIVMGPPLLAPGSLALVGGLGLAAAAFGRERCWAPRASFATPGICPTCGRTASRRRQMSC